MEIYLILVIEVLAVTAGPTHVVRVRIMEAPSTECMATERVRAIAAQVGVLVL